MPPPAHSSTVRPRKAAVTRRLAAGFIVHLAFGRVSSPTPASPISERWV